MPIDLTIYLLAYLDAADAGRLQRGSAPEAGTVQSAERLARFAEAPAPQGLTEAQRIEWARLQATACSLLARSADRFAADPPLARPSDVPKLVFSPIRITFPHSAFGSNNNDYEMLPSDPEPLGLEHYRLAEMNAAADMLAGAGSLTSVIVVSGETGQGKSRLFARRLKALLEEVGKNVAMINLQNGRNHLVRLEGNWDVVIIDEALLLLYGWPMEDERIKARIKEIIAGGTKIILIGAQVAPPDRQNEDMTVYAQEKLGVSKGFIGHVSLQVKPLNHKQASEILFHANSSLSLTEKEIYLSFVLQRVPAFPRLMNYFTVSTGTMLDHALRNFEGDFYHLFTQGILEGDLNMDVADPAAVESILATLDADIQQALGAAAASALPPLNPVLEPKEREAMEKLQTALEEAPLTFAPEKTVFLKDLIRDVLAGKSQPIILADWLFYLQVENFAALRLEGVSSRVCDHLWEFDVELKKQPLMLGDTFVLLELVLQRLESALQLEEGTLVGVPSEEGTDVVRFRIPSPRFLEAALQFLYPGRFKRFRFGFGTMDPDEMWQAIHRGVQPVGLFIGSPRFGDSLANHYVPDFFFTAHDIYHAADRAMVPEDIWQASAAVYRALKKLPPRLQNLAGPRLLSWHMVDLEHLRRFTLNDFFLQNWFHVHAFFVFPREGLMEATQAAGVEYLLYEGAGGDPEMIGLKARFAPFYTRDFQNGHWASVAQSFVTDSGNILGHAQTDALKDYLNFIRSFRAGLAKEVGPGALADIFWYLHLMERVVDRELSIRAGNAGGEVSLKSGEEYYLLSGIDNLKGIAKATARFWVDKFPRKLFPPLPNSTKLEDELALGNVELMLAATAASAGFLADSSLGLAAGAGILVLGAVLTTWRPGQRAARQAGVEGGVPADGPANPFVSYRARQTGSDGKMAKPEWGVAEASIPAMRTVEPRPGETSKVVLESLRAPVRPVTITLVRTDEKGGGLNDEMAGLSNLEQYRFISIVDLKVLYQLYGEVVDILITGSSEGEEAGRPAAARKLWALHLQITKVIEAVRGNVLLREIFAPELERMVLFLDENSPLWEKLKNPDPLFAGLMEGMAHGLTTLFDEGIKKAWYQMGGRKLSLSEEMALLGTKSPQAVAMVRRLAFNKPIKLSVEQEKRQELMLELMAAKRKMAAKISELRNVDFRDLREGGCPRLADQLRLSTPHYLKLELNIHPPVDLLAKPRLPEQIVGLWTVEKDGRFKLGPGFEQMDETPLPVENLLKEIGIVAAEGVMEIPAYVHLASQLERYAGVSLRNFLGEYATMKDFVANRSGFLRITFRFDSNGFRTAIALLMTLAHDYYQASKVITDPVLARVAGELRKMHADLLWAYGRMFPKRSHVQGRGIAVRPPQQHKPDNVAQLAGMPLMMRRWDMISSRNGAAFLDTDSLLETDEPQAHEGGRDRKRGAVSQPHARAFFGSFSDFHAGRMEQAPLRMFGK